ncbi:signal peptidase I [Pelagibacteraceae bacterium]|jgi:signal peptidase I|nr:signal peptidase I [Pelagibacteraceae bacterium]MDC0529975.1 signal peptidase I [Pelagibacteraceae bacterium]MDC0952798.1 signal peptidase I [Pelagibacteraceae bacterium]
MTKKNFFIIVNENIKTLIGALIIAILIRSLLFQPFYIPSSSMEPTLLVGDRIFVSKYIYGYSKHSFPFSPNISNNRFFSKQPKRGDLVVFKTPADNRTDYIKRLIGLPGDTIQFIKGDLFINEKKIKRIKIKNVKKIRCGNFILDTNHYTEILPNGLKHKVVYKKNGSLQNTKKFKVPFNHYFLLGDNRDCSKDSRYLDSVGYVNNINIVGKAKIIFFSNDTNINSMIKFWNLNKSFRLERLFKIL